MGHRRIAWTRRPAALVFPVIAIMFVVFDRLYRRAKFRLEDEGDRKSDGPISLSLNQ